MLDWLGSGTLSILAFVMVMGFVVIIHELGHYWAGRLCGVHADAFSMGFGPTLVSRTDKLGTVWKVSALPLGGFVQFRGDANAASAPDYETLDRLRAEHPDPDSVLHFKPVWQRAFIVAAGPLANFLLAMVLFSILGVMNGERVIEPRIGVVEEGSAAAQGGFMPGDLVTEINGSQISNFNSIREYVATRANQPIRFTVERDGSPVELTVTPDRTLRPDGLGGERAVGFMGVGVSQDAQIQVVRPALWEAPIYGVTRTVETTGTIISYLSRLVTGRASTEHINGPVGIATTAGQLANLAVSDGGAAQPVGLLTRLERLFVVMLALSALLSVGLGLMNLLPIPVLDGGHLVYYAYEAIAKRPPSPSVQEMGFRLGLGLILAMFLVATWNDLSYLRGQFL
ncbi:MULTISPECIES: M50 family metallopeptidase [Oceanicaulis]|uniref:M50 family metallopeptidase n=1 Tax=Oceanicaulis TaxID=153232 RepID=UPI002357BAAC|nr:MULTISPECIES: M50 family metallopeptidase [Oceanicaulis]|tara:strand:- start:11653 stop:12846 length:1194 start_codon:yes stop_codon:yes gene_type:complete